MKETEEFNQEQEEEVELASDEEIMAAVNKTELSEEELYQSDYRLKKQKEWFKMKPYYLR